MFDDDQQKTNNEAFEVAGRTTSPQEDSMVHVLEDETDATTEVSLLWIIHDFIDKESFLVQIVIEFNSIFSENRENYRSYNYFVKSGWNGRKYFVESIQDTVMKISWNRLIG